MHPNRMQLKKTTYFSQQNVAQHGLSKLHNTGWLNTVLNRFLIKQNCINKQETTIIQVLLNDNTPSSVIFKTPAF